MSMDEVTEVKVTFQSTIEFSTPLPESGFQVPVTLARYGLSEIVNQLTNTDPPRPFDFLVKGGFLRTTLKAYLATYPDMDEQGVTLEVIEAARKPSPGKDAPHPDWISSIQTQGSVVVTGCYDGRVRLFQDDLGKPTHTSSSGHRSAIKAITLFHDIPELSGVVASGGKDRVIRAWKFGDDGSSSALATFTGHSGSVEALASKGTKLCSAGWDRTVRIWDCAFDTPNPEPKKRKVTTTEVKSALSVLEGHTLAVNAVTWPHPVAIYSGGDDCTIRMWDVSISGCTQQWPGSKPISSLDFSLPLNLLLSAHPDSALRVWDPRSQGAEVVKLTLKSHRLWTTAAHWSPVSPHMLVSTSFDNSIKLWDIRSPLPLHTITAHSDKVLAAAFSPDGSQVLSGGVDAVLRSHTLKTDN